MNVLRRLALFALDLNTIQNEAMIRLRDRLGFYKKLYAACGLPEDVAARIEEKMIGALYRGVAKQHELASRWIKGETNLADFRDRYLDWVREHLDRYSRILVEDLRPAM